MCAPYFLHSSIHGLLGCFHVVVIVNNVSSAAVNIRVGFPGSSVVKNLPANAGDRGDMGSIPGSEDSPGGGNGNSFQHSRLGKSHGQRSLAGYNTCGGKESDTT